MEYKSYDTLPYVLFCEILSDQSKVELLGMGEKSKDVWEGILSTYRERNPTKEEGELASLYGEMLREEAKVNRAKLLLSYIGQPDKEVFHECGVAWHEDPEKRVSSLVKAIDKHRQKFEIYKERYLQKEKKVSEDAKKKNQGVEPIKMQDVYNGFASMEVYGIAIGDYNKITCARHDALNEMIQKKIEDGQRHNTGKRISR